MTKDQIDSLVADLAHAVASCKPNRGSRFVLGGDELAVRLRDVARALDLPEPGPLLPPDKMPWREVRELLAYALCNACVVAVGDYVPDDATAWRTIEGDVRRAIALATGSAS